MRHAAVLMPMLALAGCAFSAPADALSVRDVWSDLDALDGQEVRIAGWMGDWCGGLDCRLFQSELDAKTMDSAEPISDEWMRAFDNSINLCVEQSDQLWISLVMLEGEVLVTGRVDKNKMKSFGFDGCDFKFDSISKIGV